MNPEDVPAEIVEKAARHRAERHFSKYSEYTWEGLPENVRDRYLWSAADYLAAVLPDIQAQTLRDALPIIEASGPFAYSAVEQMAARLTPTTEEPTT